MKTQKLIVIAAIVCLLVGASGAAMAYDVVCSDEPGEWPYITDSFVFGDVNATGNCYIQNSTIIGNIIVKNGDKPLAEFSLYQSTVSGRVEVEGGLAFINKNSIRSSEEQAIFIKDPASDTVVYQNLVSTTSNDLRANIRVDISASPDTTVAVVDNTVTSGDIQCVPQGNKDAYALKNLVPDGTITCFGQ